MSTQSAPQGWPPQGWPLFSFGFRPFFLGGGAWAAMAMLLWLALLTGRLDFAGTYGALAWHGHELLFGYAAAIVAGFLLTAVPNWTGRLPVRGAPLLALFLLWLAGRAAMLAVDAIGFAPAAIVDSLFLPVLAAVILREILAGGDRRNLKVLLLVTGLAGANIAWHLEVHATGLANHGMRAGVAVLVALIMLIGGRVTPSFTHNWLVRGGHAQRPVPFGPFDKAALAIAGLSLALWVLLPAGPACLGPIVGIAFLLSGLLHAVRLGRWAGFATWREPLVLVLHLGYAFVPLGFLLLGAGLLWPEAVPASAALHAWMAGAIGVMTLAIMTRASLGHTGRGLAAGPGTRVLYLAVALAALLRLAGPLLPDLMADLLVASAACWFAAFAGFVLLYGPMLAGPKRSPDAPS